MESTRPLTDRIVARAVSEGLRLAVASGSQKLPLTIRLVVERLEPFVRNVALRLAHRVTPQRLTDDVAQDSLIVLATRLVHLERVSVAGLEAFAYGIVRHRALAFSVREHRLRGAGTPHVADEPSSAEIGPLENAIRNDQIQSIRRAAIRLRRGDQRLAEMMLLGEDSRAEIARRLEISLEAAAMRKSRVLRVLRNAMSGRHGDRSASGSGA